MQVNVAYKISHEENMDFNTGPVYWLTGLSGAGKSTIGNLLAERLRLAGESVIYLDGDVLREVFGHDRGHSLEDRLAVAYRNARLCRMLSEQGVTVVCATISMFEEVRSWNREHITSYREIYLRVAMETLIKRDPKGIYARALEGKLDHVMGIDLPIEEPISPDLILDNDGTQTPEDMAARIQATFNSNKRMA